MDLKEFILAEGGSEVGFSDISNAKKGTLLETYEGSSDMNYAISIAVKLSDAVLDGITDRPTHTYFQHYRIVNAFLDRLMLKTGMEIEKMGYRYIPVAASQSINGMQGLFQHKTAARLSGLGSIGKSGLFISKKFGTRVRLGTIITDMPLPVSSPCTEDLCGLCRACVLACPAMAIENKNFDPENPNDTLNRSLCSEYMKEHFKSIGRGAVCGICIKTCKYNKRICE